MAKPTLTAAEITLLTAEALKKETTVAAYTDIIANKTARSADLAALDTSFKKFFDWYNDDIIGKYDDERKAITGDFIASPIIEDDIVKCSELDATHRTTPTLPATDIIRIDEFDDTAYTASTLVNETQHIADQAVLEGYIASGTGGTTATVNATTLTNSALTSASTTLDVIDANSSFTISIGDDLVIHDGGTDAAVVRVTGVTDNMGSNPPYDFTLNITVLVAPVGTIATTGIIESPFTGFTNSERTSPETATDSNYQPVLDAMLTQLTTILNARIARLAEQTTAIGANDDPDAVSELATAQSNINTSDSFIDSHLGLSSIANNAALSSLATERGVRGGQLTTRESQIIANYTGQTEDYYEQRYQRANDRASTVRGTLRTKKFNDESIAQATSSQTASQDAADAYNNLLT